MFCLSQISVSQLANQCSISILICIFIRKSKHVYIFDICQLLTSFNFLFLRTFSQFDKFGFSVIMIVFASAIWISSGRALIIDYTFPYVYVFELVRLCGSSYDANNVNIIKIGFFLRATLLSNIAENSHGM